MLSMMKPVSTAENSVAWRAPKVSFLLISQKMAAYEDEKGIEGFLPI
jgi:hypothetical protein